MKAVKPAGEVLLFPAAGGMDCIIGPSVTLARPPTAASILSARPARPRERKGGRIVSPRREKFRSRSQRVRQSQREMEGGRERGRGGDRVGCLLCSMSHGYESRK